MTVNTTVGVFGVKEALKELREIDPDMRKLINARAKDVVKPATEAIKAQYPARLLSGMSRSWQQRGRALLPYDQAAARRGVTVKVNTSRKSTSVISVIQKNPAAAIVDMAGKRGGSNAQGARFIDALTSLFGAPSRVMWPTYERNNDKVVDNMRAVIDDLMAAVNKRVLQ
jgi:hypothetical protein